jgi:peptidyl-prolyl cis-trans isomerase B (cyclophilin B)
MLHPRLVALAIGGLILAACSSAGSTTTTTASSSTEPGPGTTATTVPLNAVPADYAGFLLQTPACGATAPEPVTNMQFNGPADTGVTDQAIVTMATSCGSLEITVDPEVAPETVNSFVFLAEQGFFDGTVSHRVLPGFMMQAGDPTATGIGGPGYTIPDELPQSGAQYQRGVVAMANAGPNTSGSQFFVLFGPADWLPPSYSIFGQVTSGLETLDAIEQIPLGQSPSSADGQPSTPLESLYIESVTVTR